MPDLAADPVDAMLIDVRANTRGFAEDVARMRQDLDGELVAGFSRAGEVLERSLLRAIRRGSLGFEDLQASASKAIDRIAAFQFPPMRNELTKASLTLSADRMGGDVVRPMRAPG